MSKVFHQLIDSVKVSKPSSQGKKNPLLIWGHQKTTLCLKT